MIRPGAVAAALVGSLLLVACGSEGALRATVPPTTTLQLRDAGTGAVRWSVALPMTHGATEPVLAGGTVLVAEPGGPLRAHAVTDGALLWSRPDTALPAAVVGDLLVLDLPDRVEGVDAATGAVRWTRRTRGDVVAARDSTGVALVADGTPLCGVQACPADPTAPPVPTGEERPRPSAVAGLDPATGQDRWSAAVPGTVDLNDAAVGDDLVVVPVQTSYQSERTVVVGLGLTRGERAWSVERPGDVRVEVRGPHLAFVRGATAEGIDPRAGSVRWSTLVSAVPLLGSPYVDVTGTSRPEAFRRDPATGEALPGRVPDAYDAISVADLLVATTGEALTALRGATPLWSSELPAGERPITYLDTDGAVVASVTAVGQEPTRD